MPHPPRKTITATLSYGLVSAALYGLLIAYSDLFVELAQRTREGEKAWFLIPLAIAFLFSWVHGNFTGYFWEALGLRAAHGGGEKNK